MIREGIIQKYQEIQAVLDEDLRITLSHLEMEERAAVSALDGLMERNCSLIQEIEQDLARLTLALDQTDVDADTTVKVQWTKYDLKCCISCFHRNLNMILNKIFCFQSKNNPDFFFCPLPQSFFSYPDQEDLETANR